MRYCKTKRHLAGLTSAPFGPHLHCLALFLFISLPRLRALGYDFHITPAT